eukprot:TRINITY_DN84055_c0_g1_i1.p1 TRINITY_DN84055_c0_g1~~TRINITY_DN84055_c0_g1_i1.p1  ORF type:complete len:210 (-),score=28.41 TRINITY_DN84055_c0_g1_i1:93-722(-)
MALRAYFAALACVAALGASHEMEWIGCESFPGFGSARDDVRLVESSGGGHFNITTLDFLSSRSCTGSPSLTWGHYGGYTCGDAGEVVFERKGVWIEAHSLGGLLFGKVLCPHISLQRGVRTDVALEDLPTKCASITFNNCATFYDTLATEDAGKTLHRSSAPACKSDPKRTANGPPLTCSGSGCLAPCSAGTGSLQKAAMANFGTTLVV